MMVTDEQLDAIPGWFPSTDVALWRFLLQQQSDTGAAGNLGEMGVYLGKSSALLGAYLREGEKLTVVDLFEDLRETDADNAAENALEYAGLTRAAFERNYRAIHGNLPEIVHGLSETIVDFAEPQSFRFVHVDASHLYQHVKGDLEAARALLQQHGVLVIDDFRSPHTPGVAAAAWEAVISGLNVLAVSSQKMYATWGDPYPMRQALAVWLSGTCLKHETQDVLGQPVIRVWAPEVFSPRIRAYLPPLILHRLQRQPLMRRILREK